MRRVWDAAPTAWHSSCVHIYQRGACLKRQQWFGALLRAVGVLGRFLLNDTSLCLCFDAGNGVCDAST